MSLKSLVMAVPFSNSAVNNVAGLRVTNDEEADKKAEQVIANRSGDVLIKHTVLKADHFPSESYPSDKLNGHRNPTPHT